MAALIQVLPEKRYHRWAVDHVGALERNKQVFRLIGPHVVVGQPCDGFRQGVVARLRVNDTTPPRECRNILPYVFLVDGVGCRHLTLCVVPFTLWIQYITEVVMSESWGCTLDVILQTIT
ncbi:hypothetical protein [Acidithiobacillus ferrivorans]|nr:hypothetical protein [Acidithiobacillus ferrivorans]